MRLSSGERRVKLAAAARGARRGFTLVEILATLLLIAVVLPAAMEGITLAARAASTARHRTEAGGLASEKVAELVATNAWSGGVMSGDFSPNWPNYRWQGAIQQFNGDQSGLNLQQLDVQVIWTERGQNQSVTESTLVYDRANAASQIAAELSAENTSAQ